MEFVFKHCFEIRPEAGIGPFRECTFNLCDDLQRRVVVASAQRFADARAPDDSVGPEHPSTFANRQHSRLVCRASNCKTVEAATTFFPRFAFVAKSRTFAP